MRVDSFRHFPEVFLLGTSVGVRWQSLPFITNVYIHGSSITDYNKNGRQQR